MTVHVRRKPTTTIETLTVYQHVGMYLFVSAIQSLTSHFMKHMELGNHIQAFLKGCSFFDNNYFWDEQHESSKIALSVQH